jgi:hypothetical protein
LDFPHLFDARTDFDQKVRGVSVFYAPAAFFGLKFKVFLGFSGLKLVLNDSEMLFNDFEMFCL